MDIDRGEIKGRNKDCEVSYKVIGVNTDDYEPTNIKQVLVGRQLNHILKFSLELGF